MKKERNCFTKFFGMMTIAFLAMLTLKSTGVIELSWFWVTSPIWIVGAIALFFVMFVVIVTLVIGSKDENLLDYLKREEEKTGNLINHLKEDDVKDEYEE